MKSAATTAHCHRLVGQGANLHRDSTSGVFYCIFKVAGKQIRKSLKTTDKKLARRRLEDRRRQFERCTTTDAKTLPFAEYDSNGILIGGLAHRWFTLKSLKWKPTVMERERYTVKDLAGYFGRFTVSQITEDSVEIWAKQRAAGCAAATFNRDLLRLNEIFNYAVRKGYRFDNPAQYIEKRPAVKYVPTIPSRTEFAKILAVMRSNKNKRKASASADLCEGLTYLGCRKADAAWLEWQHINFEAGTVRITGHPVTHTKNGEQRIIPLFNPFRRLLLDMRAALPAPPQPTDKVFMVKSCRKAFETACQQLKLPHYPPHHTWRRFFISHCIMAGIDAETIAPWVGHKDGGTLIRKTYTVISTEHSRRMAARVQFDAKITPSEEPLPTNITPMPRPDANAANG